MRLQKEKEEQERKQKEIEAQKAEAARLAEEAAKAEKDQEEKKEERNLPAGMKMEVTEEGTGDMTEAKDRVKAHYTGKLLDGTVFDSSKNKGRTPLEFTVGAGQVIKCWDAGFTGIKVGTKAILTCPPDLAYGERAMGPIPANSTLIFEIELLGIVKKGNDPQKKHTIKLDEEKVKEAMRQ